MNTISRLLQTVKSSNVGKGFICKNLLHKGANEAGVVGELPVSNLFR